MKPALTEIALHGLTIYTISITWLIAATTHIYWNLRELVWQWRWALNYRIHCTLWWTALLLLLSMACFWRQGRIVQTSFLLTLLLYFIPLIPVHWQIISQQQSKSVANLTKYSTQSEPWIRQDTSHTRIQGIENLKQ